MSQWVRRVAFFLVCTMFTAPACTPAQAANAPDVSTDARLAAMAHSTCLAGLEHWLPGVYYYCVGGKALAAGNYGRSRSMFEIAAAWGSKQAQFMLGLGYFKGDTGIRDRPLGLAWLELAAERNTPLFAAILRSAKAHASAGELAAAEKWRARLAPRYADVHAAHRAYRRYQEFLRQLRAAEPYGGQFCIAGLTSTTVAPIKPGDPDPGSCAGQQSGGSIIRGVNGYAQVLFDGWQGRVTVGGIAPASAASVSGH